MAYGELAAVAARRSCGDGVGRNGADFVATVTVATAWSLWRWWRQRLDGGDSTVAGRRKRRLPAAVATGCTRGGDSGTELVATVAARRRRGGYG
uniref:DUF834 domain-containing protein n=1 Tax=Oryza barthii TaxID=65489 RepID=A0A0D3F2Q3_9ORYZ